MRESDNHNLQRQLEVINNEINQRENKIKELRNQDLRVKEELERASQKVNEFERMVKNHEITIKSLENARKGYDDEVKEISFKQENEKNHYLMEIDKYQVEISRLNEKLSIYDAKMNNNQTITHYDWKMKDYLANQIFEEKVIYDLKAENERLRRQLHNRGSEGIFEHRSERRSSHKHGKKGK